MFLSSVLHREWRDYCNETKGVSFTYGTGPTSSRDDTHEITLPRFSSASVPQVQVTHLEDGRDNNTDRSDFILFAGGNVWSLDWCPRLCDKPCSPANCEYLAVAAHPPGSSNKIGMPLTGRGIIQVWCLVAPFEEAYTHQSMIAYSKSNFRGRPRKLPDVNNSINSSSVPRKPVGRPRKIKLSSTDDHAEPILKRPRGRPRKYPLSVGKVLDSAKNKEIQDSSLIDPLVTSGVIPGDLALSCAIPTVKPLESTPKKGRGRPRKISKCSPVPFVNGAHIIDELEDTEVAPLKESSNNSNIITCAENLNFSAIPKGIHLPRVVLCLEHNGEVAWDIKWKPPLPNQSEQKSRLGFLAILFGDGSVEVWEVPSPSMIQKIYSSSSMDGTDPRFLELRPVFRCAKVKCGNRQSIPLTVDWSPSPHDMILAGCHDGTVALWKFSADLSSQGILGCKVLRMFKKQAIGRSKLHISDLFRLGVILTGCSRKCIDSKPFMCVTAESVTIRALSWAPYVSEENTNTFVTAGEHGLKFWDIRDPYRPLWELRTAPKAVISLHWLKDTRGIVISLEDGTLKFLSLSRIANDVPVTGRPFGGTKTQGVYSYQLSEYLIWNVHVSEITGYAAYCGADGTAVRFQLTSRFWEKEPRRNRAPYFLCGSLVEEGTVIKIGGMLQYSPLPNVPLVAKKGPKAQNAQKEKLQTITNSEYVDPEPREGQLDGPDEGQECNALVLAEPLMQENGGICNGTVDDYSKDFEVFPPKSVALHRLRWNMNKGSEKWLCYGGAAGIIRCQRI